MIEDDVMEDVMEDDVMEDDNVMKDDVIKDDVIKDDLIKDDEDVMISCHATGRLSGNLQEALSGSHVFMAHSH